MRRRRVLLVVVLAAGGLIGVRFTQNRRNAFRRFARLNPVLEAIDRDGNAELSPEEIVAASAALKTLDTDHDGTVTETEMLPRAVFGGRGEPTVDELADTLHSFDRNGDGNLAADEVPERMRGLVDRGDTNHDGQLTKAEIRALADLSAAATARAEYWPGDFITTDRIVSALDTNHDRRLSPDEIANAPRALKTLDHDGDGKISLEELRPPRQWTREL